MLITGGAGFIDSHLADHLIENGHSVAIVDNDSTGGKEMFRPERGTLRLMSAVSAGYMGRLRTASMRSLISLAHVSLIGPLRNRCANLHTNAHGTVNVLQLCLRYSVPRLLYASSMTAYGRSGVSPTLEETPCEPISHYAITKYPGERYVRATPNVQSWTSIFA